ncbi:MAG TPA: hypothetical protein VFS90_17870 [Pyrinomonadaceae bacterium]|nr:hypothetical protein [Pyrinomonadaceae bacterium]
MTTLSPTELPLAPLGAGDLIDRAVRLYRRHLFVLIRTAAPPVIIVAVGWVLTSLSIRKVFFTSRTEDVLFYGLLLVAAIVIMLAGYLFILVVMGGATRTLVAHLLRNDPVTARATYTAVRVRFWGLFVASLIMLAWIIAAVFVASSGAQMIGMVAFFAAIALALVAPGWMAAILGIIGTLLATGVALWLFFLIVGRIVYVPQVMLVEGKGVFEAVGRSFSLARGNVRRLMAMTLFTSFGIMSAMFLLFIIISFIGAASGINMRGDSSEWPAWFAVLYSILGPLSSILLTPVWMLGLSLLYVDERVRHEGYDIELMAARQLGEFPDVNVTSPLGTALHSMERKPELKRVGISYADNLPGRYRR